MEFPRQFTDKYIQQVQWLFTALLLSFPFGSFIFSFSVGFMTVYPYLIIVVFLTLMGFKKIYFPKARIEKVYLIFVSIFLLYAILLLVRVDSVSYAIVDLRNIMLMLLTTYAFLFTKHVLGFEQWKKVLLQCLTILLILISTFALCEIFLGWHIASSFTEKISLRGIDDDILNIPVFLWENPNNFLTYVLLIVTMIALMIYDSQNRHYLIFILSSLALLFVIQADSFIGNSIWVLVNFLALVYYLLRNWFNKFNQYLAIGIGLNICLIYVFATQNLYTEIPRSSLISATGIEHTFPQTGVGEHLNNSIAQIKANSENIEEIALQEKMQFRNTTSERAALIRNGIEFLIESKFLGVGPGQYRYKHDQNEIKYFAFGNNGPHAYIIELFSQYGVVIGGSFLLFLCYLLWIVFKLRKYQTYVFVSAFSALIIYGACSILPSAFLILDINWIFLVVLVIFIQQMLYLSNQKKLE